MRVKGLSSARAAWWARRTARQVRADLDAGGLDWLVVLPPPPLPQGCRRWVAAVLRSRGESCLVRSAVLQAWDAAHGRPRDLIIGVTAPGDGFKAHAWLEGDSAEASADYSEVSRRVPPGARSGGGGGDELLDESRKIVPRP